MLFKHHSESVKTSTPPSEAIVLPLVDACGVVHGLHPAGADAPDVDLLLVPGEGGEAARAVGEVRHLVITRVTAERLQNDNIIFCRYLLLNNLDCNILVFSVRRPEYRSRKTRKLCSTLPLSSGDSG